MPGVRDSITGSVPTWITSGDDEPDMVEDRTRSGSSPFSTADESLAFPRFVPIASPSPPHPPSSIPRRGMFLWMEFEPSESPLSTTPTTSPPFFSNIILFSEEGPDLGTT